MSSNTGEIKKRITSKIKSRDLRKALRLYRTPVFKRLLLKALIPLSTNESHTTHRLELVNGIIF